MGPHFLIGRERERNINKEIRKALERLRAVLPWFGGVCCNPNEQALWSLDVWFGFVLQPFSRTFLILLPSRIVIFISCAYSFYFRPFVFVQLCALSYLHVLRSSSFSNIERPTPRSSPLILFPLSLSLSLSRTPKQFQYHFISIQTHHLSMQSCSGIFFGKN